MENFGYVKYVENPSFSHYFYPDMSNDMLMGNEPMHHEFCVNDEGNLALGDYYNSRNGSGVVCNGHLLNGNISISNNDGFYICGDRLDFCHISTDSNKCWSWDNKNFESEYQPLATEEKMRRAIDKVADLANNYINKVLYYRILELYEEAEDKGNWR